MATTVKLVLRKSNTRRDGTAPIFLRITKDRRSRFLSTGVYIAHRHWNAERQQVRRSHELADAFNARLHDLRVEALTLALDVDTANDVKRQLTGSGGSLTVYLERYIEMLDQKRRFWAWKRYRVLQGKMIDCFGARMDWKDLDLSKFEHYLADELKNGPNTIRKELSLVRSMVRQAIKEGVLRADHDPFLRYDPPKAKQPNRRKLALEEIEQLAAVELEPHSWAEKARDAWMISFYLGGMRFGDVASLKVENLQNGRCRYRMNKTGKMVSLPVPQAARGILAPYLKDKDASDFVLPFLQQGDDADPRKLRRRIGSKNVLCNRYIKVAAEKAELDNADSISMHIARHSFADYARSKSGNLYAISKTLGHSSLQITQTYLKSFDQEAVDQLAEELWSNGQ